MSDPGTELLGARRLRELLDARGVRLTKSLGQNFVIDPNTIRKVVETASVQPGDHVLEIGAGAGSLTLGLAAAGAKVTALEIDERLLPVLEETTAHVPEITIVQADALEYDFGATDATTVVANLPYNIAATVVVKVLQQGPGIERLTVMTQREVAERLAAPPGGKVYGATSLLVAFHGAARIAGSVSRKAFFPEPNVDSSIVAIERRQSPGVSEETFVAIVKAAFSQRRKMLRASLAPIAGGPGEVARLLEVAGVDPERRPEELDLDAFVRIAAVFVR